MVEFDAKVDLRGRTLAVLGVIVLSAGALAGCGGTKSTTTSTTPAASHSITAPAARPASTAGGGASVRTGPVRGSLRGPNHAPVAGKAWLYSVKVMDASGKPLSGTVDVEFLFGGQVVGRDSPPTHPVKNGIWRETLTFPAQAVGQPLTLQAVVHTSQGSIKLDWPVTPKR